MERRLNYDRPIFMIEHCVDCDSHNWNNHHDEAKYKRLKIKFFAAYFLALFGDWLQGPYVYQLYASYGFAENIIGTVTMYTYMNVNNTLKYYRSHFG